MNKCVTVQDNLEQIERQHAVEICGVKNLLAGAIKRLRYGGTSLKIANLASLEHDYISLIASAMEEQMV